VNYKILQGDNKETLKTLSDNSVDAIVTDPPYGIDFLGKAWDANTGALETYQECLRVLKPGGHILAFSAARTYHHLAITIEQAGFEIRDQIMWIYSSGFPKSQDVGKNNDIPEYEGWGTNLKPAHEPICLARKPMKSSIANNVQEWGTGAINIDACRIPYDQDNIPTAGNRTSSFHNATGKLNETISGGDGSGGFEANNLGRFPSNVLGEIEGYQKYFYCPKVSRKERQVGFDDANIPQMGSTHPDQVKKHPLWDPSIGGDAARLKQKIIDSGAYKGNNHPTVKPVELMKYLIKLVTPKDGIVLDPFTGSGSTGMAAVELGHEFIGCELDPDYVKIAEKRIVAWHEHVNPTTFNELFEEE
jgi:DNA modification methylase